MNRLSDACLWILTAGGTLACFVGIILVGLSGCAPLQPAPPAPSAFERCMATVGKDFYYTSDRVTAASWCHSHGNGGIQESAR